MAWGGAEGADRAARSASVAAGKLFDVSAASFVANEPAPGTVLGERYEVLGTIASGGMAVVSLARTRAASGFRRVVAVKTCLPHLRSDREFVSMFLDEARLAALIHHPNVVATLDLGEDEPRPGRAGALYLVMEYVEGETLSAVLRRGRIPAAVALRIVLDGLAGLQAAHELVDEDGASLEVVHRDISPQNLIVGLDGIARVMDFGIAKARSRSTTTEEGVVKGKLAYMSPEQLSGARSLDRRADLFAMGVVLWELLTGQRLFRGQTPQETISNVVHAPIAAPSEVEPESPPELDPVVLRALSRDARDRHATARELIAAILRSGARVAEADEVAALMESRFGATLRERRSSLLRGESSGAIRSLPSAPIPASAPLEPGTAHESSAVQRTARATGFSALHGRRGASAAAAIAIMAGCGVVAAWALGAPGAEERASPSDTAVSPQRPGPDRASERDPGALDSPQRGSPTAETTTTTSEPSENVAPRDPTPAPVSRRPRVRRVARESAASPSAMSPGRPSAERRAVLPIDRDEF
jgi:serine/threonine-protein kinase